MPDIDNLEAARAQHEFANNPIMKYFTHSHLPLRLQEVSRPFCNLACHLCDVLPAGPERTVALRKLLESKDAAVRAALTD